MSEDAESVKKPVTGKNNKNTKLHSIIEMNNFGYVDAIYKEAKLPEHKGNPLIEALPAFQKVDKELIGKFGRYPSIDLEIEKSYSQGERMQCVSRLDDYIEPMMQHFEIMESIGLLVRSGYVNRNPLDGYYNKKIKKLYRRAMDGENCSIMPIGRSTASTKAIFGMSGVGKTTSLERSLSFLPQVVCHPKHGFFQISWLKLDCPLDGSLKQFLLAFLQQVDNLLGTPYRAKLGKGKTIDELILNVAIVAATHNLGVLVIDEIQNLLLAAGVGQDKMLNFFVTFTNQVKIPVVVVGTSKALKMLQGTFREARRIGDNGVMIWKAFVKDRAWELFIKNLWQYQWTKVNIVLESEINKMNDAIFYETQGITALVVRLFQLSQIHAIFTGQEKLSVEIIHKVAKQNFGLLSPMLNAMRNPQDKNNAKAIEKYEDILTEELNKLGSTVASKAQTKILSEASDMPKSTESPEKSKAKLVLQGLSVDSADIRKFIDDAFDKGGVKTCLDAVTLALNKIEENRRLDLLDSPKQESQIVLPARENALNAVVAEGVKNGQTPYEALLDSGRIANFTQE